MMDLNPILRERLLAVAVFGAISVGSVAAVDTMVTGGFDFPVTRAEAQQRAPQLLVMAEDWSVTPRAEPVSWIVVTPDDERAPAADDLDGAALADEAAYAPTEAEIYEEIRALYEEAPPMPEDDPSPIEEANTFDGKTASASGSASPW